MKKLIILSLVLFALNAKCQFFSKFKPIASIEAGVKNRKLFFYYTTFDNNISYIYPKNTFYSDINIGVSNSGFYLTANIVSNFNKSDMSDLNFSPFLSEYYLDFYYKKNAFKIGYQHFCSHPTISQPNKYISENIYIMDSHDRFYIKFNITK